MKSLIIAAALFAAAAPAMAQTNVNISIGQPGFYGRISVGDFPQPQVVYAQPVIVERQLHYVGQPIYLRVPPGHMKHWSKHCRRYNACAQQVYFVRDEWYSTTYAPRYREQSRREHHGRDGRNDHDERRGGHGRQHDRKHGHDD
jgi:hypothetical protein